VQERQTHYVTLLHNMAIKISEIGSSLSAITHDVRTLQRTVPPKPLSSTASVINLGPTISSTDSSQQAQFRLSREFPRITESDSQCTSD